MTGIVLAANGRPFTDPDAAEIKRQILEREVGEAFTEEPYNEGEWVVVPKETGPKPAPITSQPASKPMVTESAPAQEVDKVDVEVKAQAPVRPEQKHAAQTPVENSSSDKKETKKSDQVETVKPDKEDSSKKESNEDKPFIPMMSSTMASFSPHGEVSQERVSPVSVPKSPIEEMEEMVKSGKMETESVENEEEGDSPIHFKDAAQYERPDHIETLYIRPAPRAFIDWISNAMVGLLAAAFPRFVWQTLTNLEKVAPDLYYMATQLTFAVGVLVFLFYSLRFLYVFYANRYVVTPDAVQTFFGIIKRKKNMIYLADVRSIDTNQSIVERLFGVGTVSLGTAGTADYDVVLKHIGNPLKLEAELNRRKLLSTSTKD